MRPKIAPGDRTSAGRPRFFGVSVAKARTSPASRFGSFSTFPENYARTDLDGPDPGRTMVSPTPGLRFNARHHHVVMAGIELPVTNPEPDQQLFRLTDIYASSRGAGNRNRTTDCSRNLRSSASIYR